MQSIEAGRGLFLGQVQFQNGGPPCGACHRHSAVGFPNGGLLGPDLSSISETLGPAGLDVTLRTLFFPTMMPLYEKRPLTSAEQQSLKGFLLQPPGPPAGQGDTLVLAALALAGLVVLLGVTWVTWRNRLRGVRASLVRPPRTGDHEGGAYGRAQREGVRP